MRENCSVGCEQEGCSRQGEPEQRTTGNQSHSVSILLKKAELERSVRDGVYTERQDDRYGGRVLKATENKGGYLENYSLFDWQPVE